MTAKIVTARRYVTGRISIDVHLDTTKLLVDGVTPDPAWVFHRDLAAPATWGTMTAAQRNAWANAVRAELVTDCNARLAVLNDEAAGGTALNIEGQTF